MYEAKVQLEFSEQDCRALDFICFMETGEIERLDECDRFACGIFPG